MYLREKYQQNDSRYIFEFIQQHPFATFVMNGSSLLATHIPVLIEGIPEKFWLFGHIAYNSEQYASLKNDAEALLIFHGAHAYVSSSWYQEKDISTWDYAAVHINVELKLQSKEELESSLKKLVEHFEKTQENPLFYSDIPKKILKTHLPLITGFWCIPKKTKAIAKLHQGFHRKDINTITEELEKQENPTATKLSHLIKKAHENH